MHAGPWIALYIGAIIIWSIVIAMSRSPTLWRGSSLSFLNGAFIAGSIAAMMIRRLRPDLGLIGFEIILAGVALFARPVWLALHVEEAQLERVLEQCFTKTRAAFVRGDNGYILTVAESEVQVRLRRWFRSTIQIGFVGNMGSRKAKLIRAFIGKQFRGSFPALKVRA